MRYSPFEIKRYQLVTKRQPIEGLLGYYNKYSEKVKSFPKNQPKRQLFTKIYIIFYVNRNTKYTDYWAK